MNHAHARSRPFTGHILDGFEPSVPHIQFPVTWGLTQSETHFELCIAPIDLPLIQLVTADLEADLAIVLNESSGNGKELFTAEPRVAPWADIGRFNGNLELIHIPRTTPIDPATMELPATVLADSDSAVPDALGSRLAVSFTDECHGVFISPDRRLLARILAGYLEAFTRAASGSDRVPAIPPEFLTATLTPRSPGDWNEARFVRRERYWVLEMQENGLGTVLRRWITEGPAGHWRQGWSW